MFGAQVMFFYIPPIEGLGGEPLAQRMALSKKKKKFSSGPWTILFKGRAFGKKWGVSPKYWKKCVWKASRSGQLAILNSIWKERKKPHPKHKFKGRKLWNADVSGKKEGVSQ